MERRYPSAGEDAVRARTTASTPQTESPTFQLAYTDLEFLERDELRPVRLQLELMKPDIVLTEAGIKSTIVVFGSSRIPDPEIAARELTNAKQAFDQSPEDAQARKRFARAQKVAERSRYYREARRFAQIISSEPLVQGFEKPVVVTGGGPGIMEAANRGASDAGFPSIGLNIVLPHEQHPNFYITPELCFQFHYFAMRKLHFLFRARAMAAFPGGFGTMDEMFETLTLAQTGKIRPIPIVLFCREFWERIIDFDAMVDEGVIAESDMGLFQFADTAEQGVEIIRGWYR